MTPPSAHAPPRPSLLARFGPLGVVLVAMAIIAALASTGTTGRQTDTEVASTAGSTEEQLPITWSEATDAGTVEDLDWGPSCDLERGTVAVPSTYARECVAARPGVTGGATAPGVTAEKITVVAYEAADDDLAASLQAQLDPIEARRDTREKLVAMFEDQYEMWGRTIELVRFKGSGSDEASARADAVKVATEIGAFASIGGPNQESAYGEELASRAVVCIGCGLTVPGSTFDANAPYLWGTSMTPEQFLPILGDFILGKLFERNAEFAGDPAMRERTRVFGTVNFEQDPPVFDDTGRIIRERGAEVGYESAVSLTYQLVIPELAEKARTIIARLKEAKVTTVAFLGDPIMPIYLTQAATDQDYFPEWIITGTVLTATSTFGRRYDQQQWAHAFGIGPQPVAVAPEKRADWALHEWYYGEAPAAVKTIGVIFPPIQLFMTGIHLAGPDLSAESFRDGLFAAPAVGGSPTTPAVSYGDEGLLDTTDYTSVDDMVEVWWDADAEGVDEQGIDGTGLMRYVDGGRRYRAGEMEPGPSQAFQEEDSILRYDEIPDDQLPPQYPSP